MMTRFVESLTQAAKDMSLAYAGTDDDKAKANLETYVGRVKPAIVETLGDDRADKLLDRFAATVMAEKHRIEAAGTSRA